MTTLDVSYRIAGIFHGTTIHVLQKKIFKGLNFYGKQFQLKIGSVLVDVLTM